MRCEGCCLGWNQWQNLSPLKYGCWLWWLHCIGDKLLALVPNKKSKTICNNNTATKKYRTLTIRAKLLSRMLMPYSQRQFSQKSRQIWYLWGRDNVVNGKLWRHGFWSIRPNFQQSWCWEWCPDSPGQWHPTHQDVCIQAQTKVACEESWLEYLWQDWGEGNYVSSEAGGRRRGEGKEKIIPWTPTLNMGQLLQWVSDN